MRVPILYHDEDIVVIDKPAGIPTHAAEAGDPYPGDALRIVQGQLGAPYLGMHQRLDAETSGVLLFTVRREANSALAAAFAGRDVRKIYLALVHGRPRYESRAIDAPIAREHGDRYRVTSATDPRGQPARTRYRVLETDPSGRFSLLEVVPETGRSHQIRLHLAYLGVPVVGDTLYGLLSAPRLSGPAAGRKERSRPAPGTAGPEPRLGLHAYQLTLPHPRTGQSVTFTAPLPPLFQHIRAGLPELRLAAATHHVTDLEGDEDGLLALIQLAVLRRAPLAPEAETNVYRLINGAADGLPGLTADRYGDGLVVSVYDADVQASGGKGRATGHQPARIAGEGPQGSLPPGLIHALAAVAEPGAIYVKYRPRQASCVSDEDLPELAPPVPVSGHPLGEYLAYEEGLAYLVRPGEGWNAGLFPDMREMRTRVRAWAPRRTVLNCFAYTCGFGLAATAGGALRVLNLDLSKSVLERGQANYRANGFTPDPRDFVYGDAFDWLNRLARRGDRFELVILDPPGYAKTKTRRFSAEQDYGELAGLAGRVAAAGGMIIACCNVAGLPWRAFRDRVLEGLRSAGRSPEVAGVYHAPQLDFPAVPGGESHLKILVARVG